MSQFVLPERMGFNVSPGIMRMDSMLAKLYPRVHGPYFYPPRSGVSGLGCNPGETRDVAGGQMICGDDGKSWSSYTPPPPPPVFNPDVQPVYNPPPAYTPGGPGEPNCTVNAGGLTWVDNACVAAQSLRSQQYQDAIAAAQAAANLQDCLNGQTPADVCHSRYPGVTPSGNLPPGASNPTPPSPPPSTPPISYPTPPFQPNPALNQIVAHPLTSGGTAAGSTSGPGGTSTDTGAATSGLAAIPWYVWAGAAGAAFLLLRGKG